MYARSNTWSTQDSLESRELLMAPMRHRAAEIFGAQPRIDRWEIAVLHRHELSAEGACVRCTWLQLDTARLTDAVETYRMATLPALEEMDGLYSASLMVERPTGATVTDIQEFELALAHLHVPEMAHARP